MKRLSFALSAVLFALLGCSPGTFFNVYGTNEGGPNAPGPTDHKLPDIWAGSWGDAITNNDAAPDNMGGSGRSFRFLVTPTIGGVRERVRFSNYYGTSPVTIGSARLAVGQDGSAAVDAGHDVGLKFGGQTSVTLAPGEVLNSDPVDLTFDFGQLLAISVYLPGNFGPLGRHSSLFVKNFTTADNAGDVTADAAGTGFTKTQEDWLLINGVDVYGAYQGTLALFGSSTTDGNHSNYSDSNVYPVANKPIPGQHDSRLSDWTAKRLQAGGYRVGVVNLGIPGDTVTDDITNITGNVQNANQRIQHDLLTLPNLLGVVTYFGSIDIRSPDCKSAPAIEAATMEMIATAHAAKVPLVLATIPPSAFCSNSSQANFGPLPSRKHPYAGGVVAAGQTQKGKPNGGEIQRMAFNTWIRTTGVQVPGVAAIADFDAGMLDTAHPSFLQSEYNSGDNYHPNGNGYHREAGLLPLQVLPTPP